MSGIKAIRDLLRAQGAHVASAEDPGRLLLINSSDNGEEGAKVAVHNVDLGWKSKDKNEYEASGPRIGVVKWDADEGTSSSCSSTTPPSTRPPSGPRG